MNRSYWKEFVEALMSSQKQWENIYGFGFYSNNYQLTHFGISAKI